jgi:hypothetical protein
LGNFIRNRINFKKIFEQTNIREKIWKEIVEKTEKETGEEVPDFIKDIVNECLTKYQSLSNKRQFYGYFLSQIQDVKEILKKFLSHSVYLDKNCQILITKLVDETYNSTDNKGIKRRLWKYMNQISLLSKEAEFFEEIKKSKLDKEVAIHKFLTFYERVYEITIKILSEYTFLIAKSQRKTNAKADKFINLYEESVKKGESIRRYQLKNYLNSIDVWKDDESCCVLNSKLRNAVSHFNFYPKKNMIKIKNDWLTIDDLRDEYIQLMSFYSYILGFSIKKAKWFDFASNMEVFLLRKLSKQHIFRLAYAYSHQLRRNRNKFKF